MIEQCPKCDKPLELDRQIFCDACGFDLRMAVDAGAVPSVPEDTSTGHDEDVDSLVAAGLADPPADYSHLDADARRQMYLDKLKDAWADGTITPDQMQELSTLRKELSITETEADELSQKAIELLRPSRRDEMDEPTVQSRSYGLCLSVNVNSFFMEGFKGILDLKVENLGDMSFDSVKVEVSGDLLGRTEQWTFVLGPRRESKKKIQLKPDDPGINLVKFLLTARCGQEVYAFWAETDFTVLRETKDLRQISIQAENLINTGVSENSKQLGNVIKTQIGSLVHIDKIKDVNDLMREFRSLPPVFKLIPLEYDPERSEQLRESMKKSTVKGKRIVEPQRGSLTQTTSLSITEKDHRYNYVLIAKPSISLGKKRANDIVTRICPRSTANDILTNRISGSHCSLELTEGHLMLKDAASTNGTSYEGEKLDADPVKCKGRGRNLELAGVLNLQMDCFGSMRSIDWRQYHVLMNIAEEPLWDTRLNPDLNAFRLQRINNLGPEDARGTEVYALACRIATLGSGADCSLFFEDRGLERLHAGFVYMNGRFYLENFTDLTDVFVNSATISKNELMPLNFGDKIVIARLRLEFEQHYQLFVDA